MIPVQDKIVKLSMTNLSLSHRLVRPNLFWTKKNTISSVNANLATIPEEYDIDTLNIINNGPDSTASQNRILDSRDGLNSPESGRHQSHHCTQPSTPSIGLLDRFKRRSSEIFKTTSNGTSRDESPWNVIKNKTRPVLKHG